MDNYTELHLPEQWQDGDLLVHTDDNGFIVYSVYKETKRFNEYTRLYSIRTYVSVDIYMYGINMVWDWDKDKCKLASDEESKHFHELLHKHGKDWDAENKQLVDYNARWKPSDRTEYYYVTASGDADNDVWHDWNIHEKRHAIGNCFRTEEAAKRAADAFRELLKNNIFDNDDDDDDADE